MTLVAALSDGGATHAALQDPGAASSPSSAADTLPDQALAPTFEAPWRPERPIPASTSLETALGLPGRIVTLPVSALGRLTQNTLIVVEDGQFVPRVLYIVAVLPRFGLALLPASLGDRTGLGIKARLALPRIQDHFHMEWDGSTRKYSSTRVRAGHGPVWLEYGYDWRPEDRFFGLGLSSDEEDASAYAIQGQHARLEVSDRRTLGRGPWRAQGAAWVGPRELITRSGRHAAEPSFEQTFPALAGLLDRRVEHLLYGARLELDSRIGTPHWSRGVRGRVEVHQFDEPVEALAFRTTRTELSYTRRVYELEGGISFYRDPRTLRLLLRAVDHETRGTGTMPLHDLAVLGGSRGLVGFEPGRFHDVDAAVGRLSYIFPLALRFELDLHVEAGGVYGDLWQDARLSSLEHSYGVALRPRIDETVLGAVGVDWSREGVRVRYSLGGAE